MSFKTYEARFHEKYEVAENGCWLWIASLTTKGYGQFTSLAGRVCGAHRAAYELLVGPIPKGLHLDHLCHNVDPVCPGGVTCLHRRCVNPAHMEPVTRKENILRGKATSAVNARKTHCIYGHEFTEENTSVARDGSRRCRACVTARIIARRTGMPTYPDIQRAKTHCKRGHPFDEANTYTFTKKDGRVSRQCKACHLLHARNHEKKRLANKSGIAA